MRSVPSLAAVTVLAVGGLVGCGDDDSADVVARSGEGPNADGERPSVVVTTNILGDIVGEVLGDEADVEVIMPLGSDPHDFAASARQAEAMEEADLVVVNGAGFEEGLLGVIDSAEQSGAPVFAFADHVDLIDLSGEQEEHADEEEHAEVEGHADGEDDPHIWTDPSRMSGAVEAFAARAMQLEGIDAGVVDSQAAAYGDDLDALDAELEDALAEVPPERRVLVTNHAVFGYYADRYGFDVVGTVIPSLTTTASPSAADVEALAHVVSERRVPAIFAEKTQPTELAEVLADEVGGDVEVVELFAESLGEDGSGAETYIAMMQLNTERIATALA